jgi:hypothetical protein
MNKLSVQILSAFLLLLLAGCATVRSTVTRFHTLPDVANSEIFQIVPQDSQKGSIEFSVYATEVAKKLTAYGWQQFDKAHSIPDMYVFISYGIDNGQTVTGSAPIYGQTGGGTSYSSGNVYNSYGSASYSGTTYSAPTFGVVGSETYSARVYTRFLNVDILDAKMSTTNNPVKVFEGRVKSSGTKSDIAEVLPTMIEALFKNFPGPSGKTQTINLQVQQ